MIKSCLVVGFFALITTSAQAALPTDYPALLPNGCIAGSFTATPRPFPPLLQKVVGDVRDIHIYWVGQGGTPAQNIIARNKAIREYFRVFRARRIAEYQAFECSIATYATCTSSTGNTKTCPQRWAAGSAKVFLPATLKYQGNGLISGFTYDRWHQTVRYTMRTSGNGKKRLNLSAQAQMGESSVTNALKLELTAIRDELKRLNLPDDNVIDPQN